MACRTKTLEGVPTLFHHPLLCVRTCPCGHPHGVGARTQLPKAKASLQTEGSFTWLLYLEHMAIPRFGIAGRRDRCVMAEGRTWANVHETSQTAYVLISVLLVVLLGRTIICRENKAFY